MGYTPLVGRANILRGCRRPARVGCPHGGLGGVEKVVRVVLAPFRMTANGHAGRYLTTQHLAPRGGAIEEWRLQITIPRSGFTKK